VGELELDEVIGVSLHGRTLVACVPLKGWITVFYISDRHAWPAGVFQAPM